VATTPSIRAAGRLALIAIGATFLLGLSLVTGLGPAAAGLEQAAAATDAPSGFYYGSDSNGPQVVGGYPYVEPATGGLFASYTGEIGTWTDWTGCTHGAALNLVDVAAVNANERILPSIPGLSLYWFMAGPGADPHYNATVKEATAWGTAQAVEVQALYVALAARGIVTRTHYIPMMYMDIEGQPAAGYANGWNEIVSSCGLVTKASVISPAVDRATVNGFYTYIHVHTIFHPGVYSTPWFWDHTFGTGPFGHIPNTYEWTAETSTAGPVPGPSGFTHDGSTAQWFGGVNVDHQASWQWTQHGGDWDQINAAHLPR
jgi:hypothetical protein